MTALRSSRVVNNPIAEFISSEIDTQEKNMRLTTVALACGCALSGTLTFAREARPKGDRAHHA